MGPQSPTAVRICASTLAAVLGLLSAWLIGVEAIRPALPFFPISGDEAKATAMDHSAAAIAAWIGWPRGALWTDYAITVDAPLLADLENGAETNADHLDEDAFGISDMAARLAPADARAWLLIASLNEQSAATNKRGLAQLKMSYYTSPYNERLFPLRIQIVARTPDPVDNELRSFIDYEIGMVVRDSPDLRQSIASAYRVASAAGRQILESSIRAHDAKFLSELKPANP